MAALQIGFVGGGNIARRHAKRVQELGERVRAIADIDPETRRTFASEFGASEAYESYERMIAESPLDVVVVAVPNVLHADCAIAALEADLDVFVEKPLAHSYEAAERIAAAEGESRGRVMVGFVKAFEAQFEDARARVADGELGTVYDIDATYVRQRGIPQLGSWFTRKEVAGGGVLIDAGVHTLHLALSILDFPEVETASASMESAFGTKPDYTYLSMWGGNPIEGGGFDVEDSVRALLRTADGTAIHLHTAWASNTASEQAITIRGDEAGITVSPGGVDDGSSPAARLYSADREALTETGLYLPEGDAFTAEWRYFVDVVRGEREHARNTLSEGLAVQRVVDAIYESAESRREVSLR